MELRCFIFLTLGYLRKPELTVISKSSSLYLLSIILIFEMFVFLTLNYESMWASVSGYVCASVLFPEVRGAESPKLQLQGAMSHLPQGPKTELRSSVRAVCTLR